MQARKDEARRDPRVELRREDSGAACLAGRELDPAEALAGKASIDAEAVRLRNAGLGGTLAQIRAMILMDRIHQRSPWDRLGAPLAEPGENQTTTPAATAATSATGRAATGRAVTAATRARARTRASPPTRAPGGLPDDPDHDDPYRDQQSPGADDDDNDGG